MQETEVTMRMTNVAHARQEIGRFYAEVTYSPAGTKKNQETSACRVFARRNKERPRNLCLQGRMRPAVLRFEYISIRYYVCFNVHTSFFLFYLFIYFFKATL